MIFAVSFINGSEMYRRGSSVILPNHPAYQSDEAKNWKMARLKKKQPIVTGSTRYAATGLDALKKQKEYFE